METSPLYLSPMSQQALKHWEQHRPKMVADLKKDGTLRKMAHEAHEQTLEEIKNLMNRGMSYNQAWEMAREKYLFLPDEETAPILGENPVAPTNPNPPEISG